MSPFFRRRTSETDPAEDASQNGAASTTERTPDTETTTPARKTPARKRASRARAAKAAAAPPEDADAAEPAPSRRRGTRGGRGRTRASTADAEPAAAPAATTAEPAAKPARKRAPVRKRATKAAPAPAPAADPEPDLSTEAGFVALVQRQTELLEQQTRLLQSLVAGQGAADAPGAAGEIGIKPRMALFVDVPNILYAAERSGVTVDWEKIQAFLGRGRTLVRSIAYAPISDDPDARREMERFVLPFLDKDYRIVTKPLKRFSGGSVKANFDVELAIDILTMADRLDVIGLISGDGDFRRLVEIVSARGVRVEVVAFGHSTSKDIREVADRYIDIAAYVPQLCESK